MSLFLSLFEIFLNSVLHFAICLKLRACVWKHYYGIKERIRARLTYNFTVVTNLDDFVRCVTRWHNRIIGSDMGLHAYGMALFLVFVNRELLSRSFVCCMLFQMQFLVQL